MGEEPKFVSVAPGRQKRRQVCQTLRRYIQSTGVPDGSQMPTTQELARQFGVSYVTMHSAIGDLVRDGLLVRHQGKGTFVSKRDAASPRPPATHLTMVLPPQEDIRASYNADVVLAFVQGCTTGAAECGADLMMVSLPSRPDVKYLYESWKQIVRFSGSIFVGTQFMPLMRELRNRDFPFVMLTGESGLVPTVDYDQRAGVRLATEHLLGHGYCRIGFIGRMHEDFSAKFEFFQETLQENGAAVESACFEPCPTALEARQAARRFLVRSPLPDAVLVDNYYKAEALVVEAEHLGLRVPEDLPVMAYGTEHSGGIHPPLSLLRVPAEEIGHQGALLLHKLIRGSAVPSARKTLQPSLTLRYSCGCAVPQETETVSSLHEVYV